MPRWTACGMASITKSREALNLRLKTSNWAPLILVRKKGGSAATHRTASWIGWAKYRILCRFASSSFPGRTTQLRDNKATLRSAKSGRCAPSWAPAFVASTSVLSTTATTCPSSLGPLWRIGSSTTLSQRSRTSFEDILAKCCSFASAGRATTGSTRAALERRSSLDFGRASSTLTGSRGRPSGSSEEGSYCWPTIPTYRSSGSPWTSRTSGTLGTPLRSCAAW
mmetsp:Transcript_25042/g.69775  ORF Transcript_25042/g.69775 Transcript_25042/m.69775 type:complete len:224 (-) Transcript_25042:32-703(-)